MSWQQIYKGQLKILRCQKIIFIQQLVTNHQCIFVASLRCTKFLSSLTFLFPKVRTTDILGMGVIPLLFYFFIDLFYLSILFLDEYH